MKKIKLIRSIKDVTGKEDIKEISMKEEAEMCASDFYDVVMSSDGSMLVKDFEPAICNLCGLTSSQVAQMHIKDYMMLAGGVGKYIM